MSIYDRPFDEYDRIKQENDQYTYQMTDNPLDFQDDLFADSDLAFMEFTDEILGDVQYGADVPDMSFLPPDQRGQGPRGVANQPEEYDRVHTYNDMIGRGINEEVALDWFNSDADTGAATSIIREEFIERQDTYLRALDRLKEEDPTQFASRLNDSAFADKMVYLSHLHDKGELTAEEYERAYVDTYNNDQILNSENPVYIMETQALRDSPGGFRGADPYDYKSGDDVYIYYDPENPPGDQFQVIDPRTMLPHSRENEYRETGYVRDNHPSSEMSVGASSWMEFREGILKPAVHVAMILSGYGREYALANIGYKVATGQTLKTADYATLALAGMEAYGVIQAPTTEIDAVTGAEVVVDAGQGIGGLTYAQTIAVVDGIANEDPLGAILGSTDILPSVLANSGIPQELIDDPDFMAGVTRSLESLADGEDPLQAVEDGLSKYVREGGGFGIDLPDGSSFDIDLGIIGDALSSVGTAIGDIGSAVGNYSDPVFQYVGDIGKDFGDLVDPVIQVGQDAIDAGSEVVGDVSSEIGDVIDPVLGDIGDAGSAIDDVVSDTIGDVSSAVGDVIDPALGAVGDAGSAVDDTVRAGGRAVGDYLDPVWSFIGDNLVLTEGGAQAQQQQQQRTPTQNLFDSELKSIGSISLSEYAPLLTGDQRRHAPVAPVGTAANPARQQPQTTAESLLKPLSTQFAGQLAQDPVRQQMEKDRLASQGSLYGNLNSNPFASPFDTEEEEGLI